MYTRTGFGINTVLKVVDHHRKWKTKDGSQPSGGYAIVMRVLGVVFALTGGVLIKMAVK